MSGWSAIAALVCCAGLGACVSQPPRTRVALLKVSAAPDANSASGTQVDVEFVFDAQADAALPATNVSWFADKRTLMAGMASSLKVVELRLPSPYPSTAVSLPPGHEKAIAVYIYASYLAPSGQGRCRLTPFVAASISLHNDYVDCRGR